VVLSKNIFLHFNKNNSAYYNARVVNDLIKQCKGQCYDHYFCNFCQFLAEKGVVLTNRCYELFFLPKYAAVI
jgi:hypothetical protein